VRFRINLDPVIPHGRSHDRVGCLGYDYAGWFDRHVTVDAVTRYLVAHLPGYATALPLVAGQAFCRIGRRRLFRRMDIVTHVEQLMLGDDR
jgi:hypothetical protein